MTADDDAVAENRYGAQPAWGTEKANSGQQQFRCGAYLRIAAILNYPLVGRRDDDGVLSPLSRGAGFSDDTRNT